MINNITNLRIINNNELNDINGNLPPIPSRFLSFMQFLLDNSTPHKNNSLQHKYNKFQNT